MLSLCIQKVNKTVPLLPPPVRCAEIKQYVKTSEEAGKEDSDDEDDDEDQDEELGANDQIGGGVSLNPIALSSSMRPSFM